MAYTINGFITISDLVNNAPGQIAPFGEISADARTRAVNKGYYSDDTLPTLDLILFSIDRDGAVASTPPSITPLAMLTAVQDIRGFDITRDYIAQFAETYPDYTGVMMGPRIQYSGLLMPEWVEWTQIHLSESVTHRVWLSDSAFREDYRKNEIIVVPPINPVTRLYAPYINASNALNAVTPADIISNIEVARQNNPFTSQETVRLRWSDPTNPSLQLDTYWPIIGYGNVSTSEAYDAIRTYLVDNTSYTLEQWNEYFPDLIAIDTLVFIPTWDSVSLTTGPSGQSMYNPTVDYAEVDNIAEAVVESAFTEYAEYSSTTSLLYKALGMIVLGSGNNAENKRTFRELFPDYTILDVNGQNIDRIAQLTQLAIERLELMARMAEVDTGTGTLPNLIVRKPVGTVVWLESMVDTILFRMVTRQSYLNERSKDT